MPVQKLHQRGHLIPVYLQLHPQQLGFYPVVAHHHDHDAALFIHRQQLEAAGGNAALSGGGHIGWIIHKAADGPARLRDDPVKLLHLDLKGLVDFLRLRDGEPLAFHQLVDVQPVALGGGDPSRGGVGLLQIAQLHQIRKLVANGGGGNAAAHFRSDGLGANRLGGADVILHDNFQYLLFPVSQVHKKHLKSF